VIDSNIDLSHPYLRDMSDPSPFDDFDAPAEDVPHADGAGAGADFGDDIVEEDAFATKGAAADATGHYAPPVADDDAFVSGDHADFNADGHADPFAQPSGGDDAQASMEPEYQKESKQSDDIFAAPTALSLWEKDRRLVIEDRIRKAQADKVKAGEQGKKDIADFYKARAEALARTQQSNRSEEKNAKADHDALMSDGTLWEKVGKLANLQPKAGQSEKTARMRKLLIKLKNDKVDYDDKKENGTAAKSGKKK